MVRRMDQTDDRDFDTSSLHAKHHGKNLHRDYTAHFFRWNFARRFIKKTSRVLEIGCGVETPLANILTMNRLQLVDHYVGVDLNALPVRQKSRATFYGEFDFTRQWDELREHAPEGYDVALHLEVIEHMKVAHGRKLLKGCFELLKPGGVMLMSTPCYDGVRHAANHIHEYGVAELAKEVTKTGFVVERRFGTFMDTRHLPKAPGLEPDVAAAAKRLYTELSHYYDRDALSCFFAPLYPDHARNNLWVCRKPETA